MERVWPGNQEQWTNESPPLHLQQPTLLPTASIAHAPRKTEIHPHSVNSCSCWEKKSPSNPCLHASRQIPLPKLSVVNLSYIVGFMERPRQWGYAAHAHCVRTERNGALDGGLKKNENTGMPRCREGENATQRGGRHILFRRRHGVKMCIFCASPHICIGHFPSLATLWVDNIYQLLKSCLLNKLIEIWEWIMCLAQLHCLSSNLEKNTSMGEERWVVVPYKTLRGHYMDTALG